MNERKLDLTDPHNLAELTKQPTVPSFLTERSLGRLHDLPITEIETVTELLKAGQDTANQLRTLGEAYEIWQETLKDPTGVIYFGLSGDMVTAGLAPTLALLVEHRMIDVFFTQGANLYHDFVRTIGYPRLKTSPQQIDDVTIHQQGGVRMYDVIEPAEPQNISQLLVAHVAKRMWEDGHRVVTTRQFYYYVGKLLDEWNLVRSEGILTTCFRNNVPIFVAGPESSVTAMDLAAAQHIEGVDLEIGVGKELRDHAMLQEAIEGMGLRSNLIEIGGGVMRNTLQQIATAAYILRKKPWSTEGGEWFKRHKNSILITTDLGVPFGGASAVPMVEHNPRAKHSQGENLSWGKFDPEGRRVTVYTDATLALPLLVLGLVQNPEMRGVLRERKPVRFSNLGGFPLEINRG